MGDNRTLIHSATLVTQPNHEGKGWLVIEDGRIADLGTNLPPSGDTIGQSIDAQGMWLMPGMIDIHVHGALGFDTMDATPKAVLAMSSYFATHGVTGFLATTWTDSQERILAALENVRESMDGHSLPGAQLLGVHLEGPYLNRAKGGAQNLDHIRHAKRDEALAFLESGVIRVVSLAPEFEENRWLITECVGRDIVVSAAHTNANYEEMMVAIQQGVRHATHTFNAMTGLHHRTPGVVGAVLTSDQVRAELIADNHHVHPAAMQLLWQTKGTEGIILITDSIRAGGMPDGEYILDERTAMVQDGVCRLSDGTLAGSTLTMNNALKNFVVATQTSIADVWQTTSQNAAQALGINDRKGALKIGYDADLVLIDDNFNIHYTMVAGKTVFEGN